MLCVAVPEYPTVCRLEFRFRNYNLYIYLLLTTESNCRVLMLLSIRVETEFAEERKEDVDGVRRLGVFG